ncbi:MAG TPA: hypothetical protein VGR11_03805, partial [Solirubrobacteraceae bacterium]|nr:hypothetical protein [Solirubrobacteraceae bacterium]
MPGERARQRLGDPVSAVLDERGRPESCEAVSAVLDERARPESCEAFPAVLDERARPESCEAFSAVLDELDRQSHPQKRARGAVAARRCSRALGRVSDPRNTLLERLEWRCVQDSA